jgi:hypothetical protein
MGPCHKLNVVKRHFLYDLNTLLLEILAHPQRSLAWIHNRHYISNHRLDVEVARDHNHRS